MIEYWLKSLKTRLSIILSISWGTFLQNSLIIVNLWSCLFLFLVNISENHVEKDNMITKPRLASAGRVKGKKKTSPVAQVKKAEREQLLDQLEEVSG